MRIVPIVLTFLLCTAPAFAIDRAQTLQQAVDGYIRPAFSAFAVDSKALEQQLAATCNAPSASALDASREAFGTVVRDFSKIEFLKFGPLVEDNRFDRLLFWPDRKGIALRQVQGILAEQDPSATDLASLQQKSVAVQGLTALEYVLFGTDADAVATNAGAFRCTYGETIAAAIAETAAELEAAWAAPDGIASHIAAPKPDYADYRSKREALEELVGSMAHGVETLRDVRLLPFIGRDGESPKPKSALFWRSNLTIPAVRATFEGIRDLLATSEIGLAADEENLWVDNSTRFELGNALRAADKVTLPVEAALDDPAQKKALDYLVILTGSLQTLLGENLSAALELSVGFSSLDGD